MKQEFSSTFAMLLCLIFMMKPSLTQAAVNVKLDASTLVNSKTGQSFTDSLVTKLASDLSDIAQGRKKSWFTYFAEDLAAVEAIGSLQEALFDLSAYFAANRQGFHINKYMQGVALEYATMRCDSIVSNKFPRSLNALPAPWNKYGDSIYHYADCRKNSSDISGSRYSTLQARARRDIFIQKFSSWQKSEKLSLKKTRQKRSLVNDPSICGAERVLRAISGNLTSPGYPGNYSSDFSCVWHIEVPVKYAVKIDFDMFKLEYDKKCFFDRVEFFDGAGTNAKPLGKFCGTTKPIGIRSSLNVLTIRMTTDSTIENQGFVLKWDLTTPTPPHPGFLITANVVVDQLGPPPIALRKFSLIFKNPKTCGLKSKDTFCYFQYQKMIISKIIATTTLPKVDMKGKFVEVVFDHVIDLKLFPALYNSKKFCMRWNTTISATGNGVWSRYGGSIYKTDQFRTICHYEQPGIYAVLAEVIFSDDPELFRFTGSFYAGIIFGIIWSFVLLGQWAHSRRINVPEWLNFNQVVAMLLFLGTILSGLHLHYEKPICSFVSFLLYYFGLGVIFWQFLKAAQLSGKFDDFFAKGRNVYLFYFLLGWTIPMFIAGMAAGAVFYQREESQSCWLALVGGTIWGYTSPTYFIVMMNLFLLYKVFKKTKKNTERFNHPELRKRVAREVLQILLFVATWVFGILSVLHKTSFLMQYFFCVTLTLSILLLSLGAKQRRPGYQKIHYVTPVQEKDGDKPPVDDSNDDHEKEIIDEEEEKKEHIRKMLSMRAYKKWRKFRRSELGKSFPALRNYGAGMHRLEEEGSRSTLRSSSSRRSELSDVSSENNSTPELSSDEEQSSSREIASKIESSTEENRLLTPAEKSLGEQGNQDADDVERGPVSHQEFAGDDPVNVNEEDMQNTESPNQHEEETETPAWTRHGVLDDVAEEDTNSEANINEEEVANENNEGLDEEDDQREDKSGEDLEEEQENFEVPVITMNAFGGTPTENNPELTTLAEKPHVPSRVLSGRPDDEQDAISVMSLDDDDAPEENGNEENQEDQDLYDISMFK